MICLEKIEMYNIRTLADVWHLVSLDVIKETDAEIIAGIILDC